MNRYYGVGEACLLTCLFHCLFTAVNSHFPSAWNKAKKHCGTFLSGSSVLFAFHRLREISLGNGKLRTKFVGSMRVGKSEQKTYFRE